MDEVTKCSYVSCADSLEKEQIFHELPVCDIGLCVKWLINSGHEDLVGKDFNTLRSMRFFICNNHFTSDCYLSKGTLKENAVPRAHWNPVLKKRESQRRPFSNVPSMNVRRSPVGANQDDSSNKTWCNKNNEDLSNGRGSFPSGECSNQWCRTCATKKPNLVSMVAKNRKTEMSLLSKLKLLIEIDDEDTLPLSMCCECVRKLEQSFQFFQQIYIADNTLRHIFPVSSYSKSGSNKPSTLLKNRTTNDECLNSKDKWKRPDSTRSSSNGNTWRTSVMEGKFQRSSTKAAIISGARVRKDKFSTIEKHAINRQSAAANDNNEETVLSLLKDPCESEEELRWTDVLKIVKQENDEENISSHGCAASPSSALVSCEFCDAKFRLRKELRSHLVAEHRRQIDNVCKDCIICYDNKSLLLEHRAIYHNDKRYNCDHCQCEFGTKSRLRKHINRIHTEEVQCSEGPQINGNTCNSANSSCTNNKKVTNIISSSNLLDDRSRKKKAILKTTDQDPADNAPTATTLSTANQKEEMITRSLCPECKKPVGETMECRKCCSTALVESPLKRCKSEYRCTECSSFFVDADALAEHVVTHSQTASEGLSLHNDQLHSCDECKVHYSNVKELHLHRMRCHFVKQKDFTCLICGTRTFNSVEEYEEHIDSHCKQLVTGTPATTS